MANKKRKMLTAFVVAISLFVPCASASAASYSVDDAVEEFYEAMELIDEIYYYNVDYKKLLDEALTAVFDNLDDFSEYMSMEEYNDFQQYAEPNKSGIGVLLSKTGTGLVEVLKVFKGSPAEKAGLRKGDVIIKAGSADVKALDLYELRSILLGTIGTEVKITILRDGKQQEITAVRGTYYAPLAERVNISELLEGADDSKTAYVEITSFSHNTREPEKDTAAQFKIIYDQLKKDKVKNLIIDLRGNSGGDTAAMTEIADILSKPGRLYTFKYASQADDVFESTTPAPEFKIAVLVDEGTASSSEILASAIKESGSGIIVGTKTYGKGVGQIVVPATDGKHVIKITVAEIITRDGNKLQGVGVTPDIPVATAPWIMETSTITANSPKESIVALKKALRYLGYEIDEGPAYTAELTAAIKSFQKDAEIAQDGVCAPEVILRLNGFMLDKDKQSDEALKTAYEALK